MKKSTTVLASLAFVLANLSLTQASEEPAKKTEQQKPVVDVIPVTVYPAALPKAVLKYHLLPSLVERTPGNAAQLYGTAALVLATMANRAEQIKVVSSWLDMPLEDLPRDKVGQTLDSFGEALRQAELAAHRDRCDWDLPLRQGHVFDISSVTETREVLDLGRLFALRPRLQLAEGKIPEAIGTLQIGYSMARHVAEQPSLISGFLGEVIIRMMNVQLLTLCQLPEAAQPVLEHCCAARSNDRSSEIGGGRA